MSNDNIKEEATTTTNMEQQHQKEHYRSNRIPNRRPYTGPRKVTNLVKQFPTFEEGFSEMSKLVPEIKSYCGETAIYNAVVGNILNVIRDDVPSTINRRYPNTMSFSIDSHEVGLRTDSGIAFGWRVLFNRIEDEVFYRFRVTYLNLSTPHRATINLLTENGWDKKEDMTQSRFWNSVEGKYRNPYNKDDKNNHHHKINTAYDTDTGRKVAEATPPKEEVNESIASQLSGYKVEESEQKSNEVSDSAQTEATVTTAVTESGEISGE